MKNFKNTIAKLINKVTNIDETELETYIETPKDTKNGDYSFPCFRLAKELKKAPQIIASEIKEKLEKEIEENKEIDKIDVVGGYLNFFVNKSTIAQEVLDKQKEALNESTTRNTSNNKTSNDVVSEKRDFILIVELVAILIVIIFFIKKSKRK